MRGDRPIVFHFLLSHLLFTPHARGSTARRAARSHQKRVYPACAGIDRGRRKSLRSVASLPRMRGDRPRLWRMTANRCAFTPHARGSTCIWPGPALFVGVYPACAGIDLIFRRFGETCRSLPRMRGDRPTSDGYLSSICLFTPHARGSTRPSASFWTTESVYPACAGIDPKPIHKITRTVCLPRMRGDRPTKRTGRHLPGAFTPHARGSTGQGVGRGSMPGVYPACAGIDRSLLF